MEESKNASLLDKVGEVEVVYKRKAKGKISERPQIKTSQDAYDILHHWWNKDKLDLLEQFKVLLLNRSHRALYLYELSSGGMTSTVADPRLVMMAALQVGACCLILAHNHPSGCLKPSLDDEELTHKIKTACSFLDIKVLDHVIVSSEGYFSFADEGLL